MEINPGMTSTNNLHFDNDHSYNYCISACPPPQCQTVVVIVQTCLRLSFFFSVPLCCCSNQPLPPSPPTDTAPPSSRFPTVTPIAPPRLPPHPLPLCGFGELYPPLGPRWRLILFFFLVMLELKQRRNRSFAHSPSVHELWLLHVQLLSLNRTMVGVIHQKCSSEYVNTAAVLLLKYKCLEQNNLVQYHLLITINDIKAMLYSCVWKHESYIHPFILIVQT